MKGEIILKEKKTRCIHIFPRFKNNFEINEIRKKYDYLYNIIEPHITLVFPFNSDVTIGYLKSIIKSVLKNEKKMDLPQNSGQPEFN